MSGTLLNKPSLPGLATEADVGSLAELETSQGFPSILKQTTGRLVLLAATVLTGLVFSSLVALAWFERNEALEGARARGELLARVLVEHATSTVETTALTLRTVAESMAYQPSTDADRLQPLLSQSLQGLPFLRGLAVLDSKGLVLASTVPTEVGLRLALDRLGTLPRPGAEKLLPLKPGRGLADLAQAGDSTALARRGVNVLPMLHQMRTVSGQPLFLMALINPEALANHQQLTLAGTKGLALLSSYSGQLLTATEAVSLEPGVQLPPHPIFSQWLPEREHGSYFGEGVLPGAQVVAFRVSRSRPLLVSVEQDQFSALQAWRDNLRWLIAVGAVGLLLILGTTIVALRSLSARERARRALDNAHERVAQREREMRVLLRSLQELIFRTDASGAITYVNARWTALSQASTDQAIGQRLEDLVAPGERQRVTALFSREDQAPVRSAAISVRAPDGRLMHFDVAVVPLYALGDGLGALIGFAGSAMDVTERTESRQRLQQQLALTGLLLEMSPQPVSMFDTQGLYLTVNQAWEDFSGQSRQEVIGQPVGRNLPPAEAAFHAAQDAKLLAEGGRVRYETQVLHRDGRRRDMVITKVLVPDEQGGMLGILCTLVDVSEFRDAERATREARDVAQEASRAKSEFVANMSHELRTPLQSILGFSELGLKRARENAVLVEMFGEIHASGQRMLALVNDLLDVAKIESSVGTFDLERTDLRGLIQPVLRELMPLMDRRQLRLDVDLPSQPLAAQVDPLRFQQVLRNVLANAIKFSPDGGVLSVHAEALPDGESHISVADQGPGIPASELDKIFEAFVQSSQTKDGSGGTGLGLAICRKIVEVHGGRISAANQAEGGAIFHIYLPARAGGDSQLSSNY
ncbi:PAS domain-containing sensor histidine kinase [Paucibacter sp. KBW04]|uniref:PAS domain-containing sensor histidine kinase n=1 Tax=Paucibacter sp. KBW04 TaxID=2153361 RepID=UPI000F55C857|nr:PAS domain S-box protein [Paucibacter sp. KBW04]RQO55845.1 PAS domain-containing sensor histidine kinase [Paucibacter sp. KBW04]